MCERVALLTGERCETDLCGKSAVMQTGQIGRVAPQSLQDGLTGLIEQRQQDFARIGDQRHLQSRPVCCDEILRAYGNLQIRRQARRLVDQTGDRDAALVGRDEGVVHHRERLGKKIE